MDPDRTKNPIGIGSQDNGQIFGKVVWETVKCISFLNAQKSFRLRRHFLAEASSWSVIETGQSEPAATNAPVGRSVHWMGCIFSFGAGWGSSQSISFCC
jgi:hypothetical protein